ncbi:MAG: lipoate--protein ligase family protein [Candidatus Bathyarchaeota archaeon]|nr:lipoate--protein ligase family protein [Candidatus Bathyarchaeota archaeon]
MKAEYKIPGGKLLACTVETENNVITELKISGDFFMHPEETIGNLEKAILGSKLTDYPDKIRGFFKNTNVMLLGVAQEDFINVIQLALDSQ